MGGASIEVAFVPDNASSIPENYTSDFILYGVNYTLYTHSYLCYGLKEAQRKVLADLVEVMVDWGCILEKKFLFPPSPPLNFNV